MFLEFVPPHCDHAPGDEPGDEPGEAQLDDRPQSPIKVAVKAR